MSHRHANRLIESSEIVVHLGPIGPTPVSESQLRPLAALEPEEQRMVWQQAVEESNGRLRNRATLAHARPEGQNLHATLCRLQVIRPVLHHLRARLEVESMVVTRAHRIS